MDEPVSLSDTGEVMRLNQQSYPLNSGMNQELLVMTVQIGDGRQDIITIHENDDPDILAQQFSNKHSLDASLQQNLAILIRQNKQIVEMRTSALSPQTNKWNDYMGTMSNMSQSPHQYTQREQYPKPDKKHKEVITKQKGTSVYERLYKQSKKKPQQPAQPPVKAKSSSTINYGEWLYIKGLKAKQAQKKKAEEKLKKEKEQLSNEVYTFHPVINEYSNLLSPRYFEKTEDLLLKKAGNYRDRLDELKSKAEEEEMKECSFTPKILPKSKSQSRDMAMPKYEELYAHAQKQREKRESQIGFNYQFHPNSTGNRKKQTQESQDQLVNRLINTKKEFQEKMEKARQAALVSTMNQNGKPLFKPDTGRNPIQRNTNVPIHEYLYSKRNEKYQKVQAINQQTQKIQQATIAAPKATDNSSRIFQQYRGKQYARLFTILDSDEDGKISAQSINIQALDNRVLQILTPLFALLDEGGEIGINEFVSHVENIWENLNVDDRAFLIKREAKVKEKSEELPGLVSQKSVKLAEKKRNLMADDIYERLVNSHKLTEMKLQKSKELLEHEQVKECTFRPNLSKGRKRNNK